MYKIFADDVLIYDSTIDDYKINTGSISQELNKSGSFVFSIYPDHFYYDQFVKLKTVIKVLKNNKIIFRGRVLNDSSNYQNLKTITCEGELGFLQDSIIRPYEFSGTPINLFKKYINEHNSQMDEFKKFNIGSVTVGTSKIGRENTDYNTTFDNLNSKLINESTGGYIHITHGDTGRDEIPTINYVSDFETESNQKIEFGSNLSDFARTANAGEIATALIPLGAPVDDGNSETTDARLNISGYNKGKDYICDESAIALRGWIFKTVIFDDVTDAETLKNKGIEHLKTLINANITIELKAIDLHFLDKSIESFKLGEYIRVISKPHNFDNSMLCNKITYDLLNPSNDSLTLGYTYSSFTDSVGKISTGAINIQTLKSSVTALTNRVILLGDTANNADSTATDALNNYNEVKTTLSTVSGDVKAVASVATDNARNIATNALNIATNADNIQSNASEIADLKTTLTSVLNRLTILESGGV